MENRVMSFNPGPFTPSVPSRDVYGIDDLFMFHVFKTRSEYEALTGKTCPAYNPAIPRKMWFDPTAAGKPFFSSMTYNVAVLETSDATGSQQLVKESSIQIQSSVAAAVNIPLDAGVQESTDPANQPVEVPVPSRPIDPATEEYFVGLGGAILVRRKGTAPISVPSSNGFNSEDRRKLNALCALAGIQ